MQELVFLCLASIKNLLKSNLTAIIISIVVVAVVTAYVIIKNCVLCVLFCKYSTTFFWFNTALSIDV